jgi:mediator of RNA polymerase II transcription subunit 18
MVIEGHRFIQGNVILYLHRYRRFPTMDTPVIDGLLPPWEKMNFLDPSGAYLLQATVQLSDGTSADIVNLGLGELENVQNTLKGVVDLVVPERLALDTRVK